MILFAWTVGALFGLSLLTRWVVYPLFLRWKRRGRVHVRLFDAERAIYTALERLVRMSPMSRAFVVIEDPTTQRFVQFCTDNLGLILDLPDGQIAPHQTVRALQFMDLVKTGIKGMTSFQRRPRDCRMGAELAMRVLREVHELPESTVLWIEESVTIPRIEVI